ncbi:hypothetical protein CCR97_24510 [Rhodoplanes elegans]|nr:autotransporter domain-containing protein [Rhodoplanes elegans]MBK5961342.1 hypothetical protein [Rhodoplanes elegans]
MPAAILVAALATPALADGGAGGRSGNVNLVGGSGGTGFSGAAGSDGAGGPISTAGSGGGGGGAAGGGAGGSSGQTQNLPGRSGGTTPGQDGLDGVDDTFPSGGGGGAGGANGATVTAPAAIGTNVTGQAGGKGGKGGNGGNIGAGGGGGGAGGYGVIVNGAGPISVTAIITGGTGGNGGNGGTAVFVGGVGGSGGDGGVGLQATGAATITNSGTIAGGNGGTAGTGPSGNGTAGAGGAGVVGSGLTIINSGTISGGLADGGAGARANAITFTGGTNVLTSNGGTLDGNIGVTGSLTLLQTTAGGATGSASYANAITGSGALIVNTDANKSVTLSGANTYSGGTTISGGTLAISSDANLGAAAGTLTFDGGTLKAADFITSARSITLGAAGGTIDTNLKPVALSGAISGTGGLTKMGGGALALTGTLSYAGTTTVQAFGTLVLGDATHAVTLPGAASVSGALNLYNGSLGAGAIGVNLGGGLIVGGLAGSAATAGSATITNNGIVDFRNTGTAGSATITTNVGASGGVPNGSGTFFYDNASGGTSRQIVNAGGMLDISFLATSGTTIGSLEGAGVVGVGGKTLTVGSNDLSTTFSGVIQNLGTKPGSGTLAGGLTKIGAGTLTLTGTNTYTGATLVAGGTLIVNGAIATSSGLTVDAGATVGGTGTLPSTVIAGTLSPGNSIGTVTVAGNLTFTSTGTYKVEVSPSAADRTNVTGTATLAGTVSALFQPGTYVTRNYVILSAAGGLAGTSFAALSTTNLPAGFLAKLSYTSTDVVLDLTAALGSVQGLNRNQQAVASSLGNAFNAGAALPPAFLGVFGLTGTPLRTALSQLSGEPATGAIQAGLQATGTFLGLMLDPFVAARSGASAGAGGPTLAFAGETTGALPADAARAYAAALPGVYGKAPPAALPAPQWTVWGAAFGGNGRVDGDAATGSHDLDTRVFGIAAGADYRVSPDAVLGFALAGGGTRWTTAGLGDGKTDTAQAGLYGSQKFGPAFVSAALAYAWHDATTTRMVSVAGETLEGRFHPQVFGARLEAGWRFGGPALGLTPYAAGQVQAFRMPGFAETATAGAGSFALAYAGETVTAPRSELGAWADARTPTRLGELILRGRAAWAHYYETDRRLTPTFQALPTASFVVAGAAPDADLALLSAAAELRLATGVTLIGKADGELGAHTRALAGTGTLRVTW